MRITLALTRRETVKDQLTGSHGYRWLDDGTISGEIVLEIDTAKLLKLMGPRALRSKKHLSILADGTIKARAVNLIRVLPGASNADAITVPQETP